MERLAQKEGATSMQEFKQKFDPFLEKTLDSKVKSIAKYTEDSSVIDYIEHANRITLSSGKRIRPYLAFLMYESLGGQEEEKALKFLTSLEIFHAFCLTHDDIMDKSPKRHHVSTSHLYIPEILEKKNGIGDLEHVGVSQAILLGDLQFTWSNEIVNLSTDFNPHLIHKIRAHFYDMINEVSIGQMLDVDIATRKNSPKELIDAKTKLKTAGYTFIKPLLIGAALSGNTNEKIEAFCREFGEKMGIAYQIQDDLLDRTSSAEKLGKPTSLDESQNQYTYFTHSSHQEGEEEISESFKQARNLIETSFLNESSREKFFSLVNFVENRTS